MYDNYLINCNLEKINYIKTYDFRPTYEKDENEDVFWLNTINLPRTNDLVYIPPKIKKKRLKWRFPISIFKDWKEDNEVIN